MKNVAIVLAGGTGNRMGAPVPKQFLLLEGRAMIEYSIDAFDHHPAIDEVAVVIHPDWKSELEAIVARSHWTKLYKVIDGGTERYMSSLNAIMAYIDYPDDTNLLLHDAARPWVTKEIIDRVVVALQCHEAVGVAVPSTDTVWEVHPDFAVQRDIETSGHRDIEPMGQQGLEDLKTRSLVDYFVARIPERKLMWRAQTPQAFRLPLIRDAYQRALQDPQFQSTDDCGVVRKYMPGTKITVVEGEEKNMKVTRQSDLELLSTLL